MCTFRDGEYWAFFYLGGLKAAASIFLPLRSERLTVLASRLAPQALT